MSKIKKIVISGLLLALLIVLSRFVSIKTQILVISFSFMPIIMSAIWLGPKYSTLIAMLGDLICAEPKALIGFAGPRVIEGTIKQKLPEGFQRAEFQLQKGFIDCIVPRNEQRDFWINMFRLHNIKTQEK